MSGYDLIRTEAFLERCSDYLVAVNEPPLSREAQHEINEHLWNADLDAMEYGAYAMHGEPVTEGRCAKSDYPAEQHIQSLVPALMAFMSLQEQGRIGDGGSNA